MEVQETRDISSEEIGGTFNNFFSNKFIIFFLIDLFLVFKWPHEAILLLLEEYNLRQNDFVTGKTSQKKSMVFNCGRNGETWTQSYRSTMFI